MSREDAAECLKGLAAEERSFLYSRLNERHGCGPYRRLRCRSPRAIRLMPAKERFTDDVDYQLRRRREIFAGLISPFPARL